MKTALSNRIEQLRRRRAYIWFRQCGARNKDAAKASGISTTHASTLYRRYRLEGMSAVADKRRGRRIGDKRRLSMERELEVRSILLHSSPEQQQLPFSLWTREAVAQLLKILYDMDIPLTTLADYLVRWGIRPCKPMTQAHEQQSDGLKRWLEVEYANVKKEASSNGGTIYWVYFNTIGGFSNRRMGPLSHAQPQVSHSPEDSSKKRIAHFVSNRRKVHFIAFDSPVDAAALIDLMTRLLGDCPQPYLIANSLRAFRSMAVKKWLEENKDRIKVFLLPTQDAKRD